MAQVTVTIAGRSYRMACADGEEAHLEQLAQSIDEKIESFRGSFGEIGDQRLLVMASVAVADELSEARRRISRLEAEIDGLMQARAKLEAEHDGWATSLADVLESAAERIERMAKEAR